MHQPPALLSALDSEQRISSKWIASETDKKHFHVTRDLERLIKEHPNLDAICERIVNDRGQLQEWRLPLEVAILILAGYTGPRAVAAQDAILVALRYFLTRAPYMEKREEQSNEEIVFLRNENQRLAENQKTSLRTHPRKSTKRFDTVALTAKLFGLPFMRVKMGLQEMTHFQRLMASVIHDLRSAKGSNKAAFEKVLQATEDLQGRFAYEELKDKLGDMSKFMFEIAMSVVEGGDPDKET